MRKYKVNITILSTLSVSKIVEAKDLKEATDIVIRTTKDNEYVIKQELKANTK
ncbi:MAG: hypothetical protein LBJ97_01105 [Mycoplasmataceae bacterium]|jgi:hypothetical protein|nr:hypothetical protein [Mycoplasmataceae bacterium]